MAPTPNFSRPMWSPLPSGELNTPTRGPPSGRTWGETTPPPPPPAVVVNMPHRSKGPGAPPNSPARGDPFDIGIACGSPPLPPVPDKTAENEGDGAKAAGSPRGRHKPKLSKVSIKSDNTTSEFGLTDSSVDLGGRDKPIINFRPHLWRHLEQDREVLNLDLFWPMKLEDIETSSEEEENSADRKGKGKGKANDMDGGRDPKGVFPFKELAPLKTFQNLHYLQLNGMMRSYQPLIWAACWVNKKLTTVRLEMALEPVICEDIKHKYRTIDDKWSYVVRLSDNQVHSEYLGAHGDGTLHEEFGEGEYLDQHAIKAGQMDVVHSLPVENMRYLPITHLTLMNFVVDAGPFFRWFDPRKLKELTFLGDCIDAGFYLPESMESNVKINSPKPIMTARIVRPGEIKLIDIKKPKPANADAEVATSAGGQGLKKKLSQIMPKWGSK